MSRRQICFWIGSLLMAAMMVCGAYGWFAQSRLLADSQPVPVSVISVSQEYQVRYQYTVAGKAYIGTRTEPPLFPLMEKLFSPLRKALPRLNHHKAKPQYQIGQTLTGYYMPSDPAIAFLRHQTGFFPVWILLAGLLGEIVTLAAFFYTNNPLQLKSMPKLRVIIRDPQGHVSRRATTGEEVITRSKRL